MIRIVAAVGSLLSLAAASSVQGQDNPWPREITGDRGRLVLYQPQPENLTNNLLKARAAISVTPKGATNPVFGAVWMTAKVGTDRDARLVRLYDVAVTRVRIPELTPERDSIIRQVIVNDFPKEGFHIALDRLSASLVSAEQEQRSMDGIKNDPPAIVFVEEKAVLLLYDGEPQTRKIENTNYERVANTSYAVVKDPQSGVFYLHGGKLWYSAKSAMGPWSPEPTPPPDLVRMMPKDTSSAEPPTVAPKIVVATSPTELIVTEGSPKWLSVTGGKLLYVKNSTTPWLREVATNQNYILLAGRWFRSASKDGPWTFVRPDSLPVAFKEIPPSSDIGNLRSSVAGTEEAQDAVLDLQIPQTAAIKRSSAKLEVKYEGDPKFKEIPDTKVARAENTGHQVLRIDNVYYAVDNGVWFTSKNATGPWVVADSIPEDEIEKIPPSEPVYNLTHVHVYESTPEVVYVGYTPGYMWSFPYYGVPIYGTGWYYPPSWWGPVYYPHPVTYGYAPAYYPYYGWGFGWGWTMGMISVGIMWGGWWGGYPGYYPPGGYHPGWGGGGIGCYKCDIDIGNRPRPEPHRGQAGDRGGRNTASQLPARNNIYDLPGVSDRMADRGTRDAARNQLRGDRAGRGSNNVFTDRDGGVHRRDANGNWSSRGNRGWQPSIGNRSAPSNLGRDYSGRARGSARAGGGFRGGGGRRR
jgi:hypothetical protein